MGYIENNLMKEEKLIYRAKLHWIVFIGPALILLLSIYFIFIHEGFAVVFFFCFIVLGISSAIRYLTSEFGVTNKRVLIKTGFIKRTSLETLLTKIEGILVDQSIGGRVFNYGTIVIKGTGGTGSPFKGIGAPMEFRKKIQELIPENK